MILVALDVRWFQDCARATYTYCYPVPGEDMAGATALLGDEGYNEQSAWAAATVEAGCRVMLDLVAKGIDAQITIQGDRIDLPDLLKRDWVGELGRSVQRFMRYVDSGDVRIKSRVGKKQTTFERMNTETIHRQVLGDLLRMESAAMRMADDQ